MAHLNAALRIHRVLEKAKQSNPQTPGIDGWCNAFGIVNVPNGIEKERRIYSAISALQDGLKSIETQLINKGMDPMHFRDPINNARRAVSFSNLVNVMSHSIGCLDHMTVNAFALMAGILGETEAALGKEEIAEIVGLLNELEQSVQVSGISNEFKEFIFRQVQVIRDAIDSYDISGVAVLRQALSTVAGDTAITGKMLHAEIDANPAEKSAMERFGNVLSTLCNTVCRADTAMNSYILLAEKAHDVAGFLQNLNIF